MTSTLFAGMQVASISPPSVQMVREYGQQSQGGNAFLHCLPMGISLNLAYSIPVIHISWSSVLTRYFNFLGLLLFSNLPCAILIYSSQT